MYEKEELIVLGVCVLIICFFIRYVFSFIVKVVCKVVRVWFEYLMGILKCLIIFGIDVRWVLWGLVGYELLYWSRMIFLLLIWKNLFIIFFIFLIEYNFVDIIIGLLVWVYSVINLRFIVLKEVILYVGVLSFFNSFIVFGLKGDVNGVMLCFLVNVNSFGN